MKKELNLNSQIARRFQSYFLTKKTMQRLSLKINRFENSKLVNTVTKGMSKKEKESLLNGKVSVSKKVLIYNKKGE